MSEVISSYNREEKEIREENTSKGKELAKNGVWQVPPAERFRGWQKLGLAEPAKEGLTDPIAGDILGTGDASLTS